MENEDEAKVSKNFSIFKISFGKISLFIDHETTKSQTSDRNFLKVSPRSQKVNNFLHLW